MSKRTSNPVFVQLARMGSSVGVRMGKKDQPTEDEVEEARDEGENDDGIDDEDDYDDDDEDDRKDKKSRKKKSKKRTDDESEDDDDGSGEKLSIAQQIIRAGQRRRGEVPMRWVKPPQQSVKVKATAEGILAAAKRRDSKW